MLPLYADVSMLMVPALCLGTVVAVALAQAAAKAIAALIEPRRLRPDESQG